MHTSTQMQGNILLGTLPHTPPRTPHTRWTSCKPLIHLSPTHSLPPRQVDVLQAVCEDDLADRLEKPSSLAAVLEVVRQNPVAAGRLRHIVTMHVFRALGRLMRDPAALPLLVQYTDQLQAQLGSIVRDRLVSLVTLSDELSHQPG